MDTRQSLQEQADIMRRLAGTIDHQAIRKQLLSLADQCDALAESLKQPVDRQHDASLP